MSKQSSEKKKVAFLGPLGTYSHLAALKAFGSELDPVCVSTIDDVFGETQSGVATHGVVPVENSTEGAVNATLDCLIDTELVIVGETVLPIEHHYMLNKNQSLSDVTKIISHKQSLAQCRKWLKENYPRIPQEGVNSNAEAARLAATEVGIAAIAGELAAELYDLKIESRGIQDRKDNTTRFLTLAKETLASGAVAPTGFDKTSILVYTANKPGALFRILEPFEKYSVSLTRIETRPARNEIWAYVFFIDFEGHSEDQAVIDVFKVLQERTVGIKNLGSFRCADPI